MSWWQVGACLFGGLLYSVLLYGRAPFARTYRLWLAALRFILVFALLWLLWAPLQRQTKSYEERPVWVVLLDHSRSVGSALGAERILQLRRQMSTLQEVVQKSGYELAFYDLSGEPLQLDSLRFTHPTTNLSQALQRIEQRHEGDFLSQVLLVSDGIFNRGENPLHRDYPFPIHTLAVGDTTRHPDLLIYSLQANRIVQKGNRFLVRVELQNTGFPDRNYRLRLQQANGILQEKSVRLKPNDIAVYSFELLAEKEGLHEYVLELETIEGELNRYNNRRNFVVEVVDKKKKLLIVAATAHPDIKAIRSALEQNGNYEVNVYIDGLSNTLEKANYDALICYQIPNISKPMGAAVRELVASPLPKWWIGGIQTDWNAWLQWQRVLRVYPARAQYDEVGAYMPGAFVAFQLPVGLAEILPKLPPLKAPYGRYELQEEEVVLPLFYQQLGRSATSRPLWFFAGNTPRQAFLLAEGIWLWRLEAFALLQAQQVFDDLIDKTVQYLTADQQRRRFMVTTHKNNYEEGERVWFEVEAYDELLQPLTELSVRLSLGNDKQQTQTFLWQVSEQERRFPVSALSPGFYRYKAETQIGDKKYQSEGAFVVQAIDLEEQDKVARFDLLRQLAQASGGDFLTMSTFDEWLQQHRQQPAQGRIQSQEVLSELVAIKPILLLLLLLAVLEWLLRKLKGQL